MPDPHPDTAFDLAPASDWALFLDVDGTLLHIAERPDLVEVGDHLKAALCATAPPR